MTGEKECSSGGKYKEGKIIAEIRGERGKKNGGSVSAPS